MRKELAEIKGTKAPVVASDEATNADAPNSADLKDARDRIAALRELDVKLHGIIEGGYAAALAAAEAKRDACLARQRGGLPLKTQLSKAHAYV